MNENKNFVDMRWKALEQKHITDCSFLVGPKEGWAEMFHGIKTDLMIVSGFMEKLFTSPLCPPFPIRIENMKPKIFKMIMEFAHLGVVREPLGKDDDAVELAIAADHLLIDSMKDVCIDAIRSVVTEENIWRIMERLSYINLFDLTAGCYQLLQEKTKECLYQEEFLSAPPLVVQKMLKVDKLHISEKQLVEYCCKWARKQLCFREAMRALLPHLRLLTLRPDDAVDILHSFLTPDELLHVLHFQICGSLKNSIPDTLNINVVERMTSNLTESCAMLIPDEAVSIDFEHLKKDDVFFWHSSSFFVQKNVITLTPKTDMYITGLEYLGSYPIVRNNNLLFNHITKRYEMQPSICLTPEAFFNVWVKISPSYYDMPCKAQTVQTKFGYHNIWESGHFVPKGQTVIFKVRLQSDVGSYTRRLWQIQDDTVNEFIQTNDSCKDFGEIVVEQCELEPVFSSTNPVSGKSPFFIKGIRYIKSC